MNKNTQIKGLYEHIKQLLPSEKFLEKNSFIIKTDNNKHHYYEFYSGVLETSQFKLNLSIPSYLDEYLGVYISITIPQFIHSGTLFEASSAGKFIVKNTLDNMGEQNIDNLSMNNIEEICNDYIKLLIDAYDYKNKVVFSLIKEDLNAINLNNSFKEIRVNFLQPVTKDKNIYLFYFDENTKHVYLNDITSTNYRSVTNAIEELATQIYQNFLSDYKADEIKWINMFVNINGQGVVLQNIKLKANIEKYSLSFMDRIFGKNKEEKFIHFYSPEFFPHNYMETKHVRLVWLNILDIDSKKITFLHG